MVRPRKDTPEGKLASERWHRTMAERVGDPAAHMRKIAANGGRVKVEKRGFQLMDKKRHSEVSHKGGEANKKRLASK